MFNPGPFLIWKIMIPMLIFALSAEVARAPLTNLISGWGGGVNFMSSEHWSVQAMSEVNDIFFSISLSISIIVLVVLTTLFMNKMPSMFYGESHVLELWWSILPMGVLIYMVFPSMKLLYSQEGLETASYSITMFLMASQWFWTQSSSLSSGSSGGFKLTWPESSSSVASNSGSLGLYEVKECFFIPENILVRVLCSSSDVIHSLFVPKLNIKLDCVPGRVNMTEFSSTSGVYYGHCTEICGMNHSFMPLMIVGIPLKDFIYVGVWGSMSEENM